MIKLPELTKAQEARIWREVRKEFPGDEMMQEIHFHRYQRYLQMKDMSEEEQIQYYHEAAKTIKPARRKKTDKLRELTKAEEDYIWRTVRKEFPADEMMQELHFNQYQLSMQMLGMSPKEQLEYTHYLAEKAKKEMRERAASSKVVPAPGRKRKTG